MMHYTYEIYDYDLDETVRAEEFSRLDELLATVYNDADYDFEADAELEDDQEAFMTEVSAFSPHHIVKSLRNFDFADGFSKWTCLLPGGHRELRVRYVHE